MIIGNGFIYLASRYTAPTKREMHENYYSALHATAWLLKQGYWTYSPILHCHEIARLHDMPTDYQFWLDYNHTMIDNSRMLLVLQNYNWKKSDGIKDEIVYARKINKPVWCIGTSHKEEYIMSSLDIDIEELYKEESLKCP